MPPRQTAAEKRDDTASAPMPVAPAPSTNSDEKSKKSVASSRPDKNTDGKTNSTPRKTADASRNTSKVAKASSKNIGRERNNGNTDGSNIPAATKNKTQTPNNNDSKVNFLQDLIGIAICSVGLLLVLSLVSYDASDASWNVRSTQPIHNWVGPVGAFLADFLLLIFGVGAYCLPVVLWSVGFTYFKPRSVDWSATRIAGLIAAFVGFVVVLHLAMHNSSIFSAFPPGGLIGQLIGEGLAMAIAPVGAALVSLGVLLGGLVVSLRRPLGPIAVAAVNGVKERTVQMGERAKEWRDERRILAEERARAIAEVGALDAVTALPTPAPAQPVHPAVHPAPVEVNASTQAPASAEHAQPETGNTDAVAAPVTGVTPPSPRVTMSPSVAARQEARRAQLRAQARQEALQQVAQQVVQQHQQRGMTTLPAHVEAQLAAQLATQTSAQTSTQTASGMQTNVVPLASHPAYRSAIQLPVTEPPAYVGAATEPPETVLASMPPRFSKIDDMLAHPSLGDPLWTMNDVKHEIWPWSRQGNPQNTTQTPSMQAQHANTIHQPQTPQAPQTQLKTQLTAPPTIQQAQQAQQSQYTQQNPSTTHVPVSSVVSAHKNTGSVVRGVKNPQSDVIEQLEYDEHYVDLLKRQQQQQQAHPYGPPISVLEPVVDANGVPLPPALQHNPLDDLSAIPLAEINRTPRRPDVTPPQVAPQVAQQVAQSPVQPPVQPVAVPEAPTTANTNPNTNQNTNPNTTGLRIVEKAMMDTKSIIEAAEKELDTRQNIVPIAPAVGKPVYELPPLHLLDYEAPRLDPIDTAAEDEVLRIQAEKLVQKFRDFQIEGHVREVRLGPVVTTYEFVPAPGVKVSRISSLSDDIAMAMEAVHVRIVAPIPGKNAVGIEIPNERRETVYLKEIVADPNFRKREDKLLMALGKDIEGRPAFANLAEMPHLLIAGTTGSGKSVSVNAMICSILCRATPDDVRFIMIDPKMLELNLYSGIPHLLLPPIVDSKKAANALKWAVAEMERRYQRLSELGVRDFLGYNRRLEDAKQGRDEDARHKLQDGDGKLPERLPYIVIVIDEYADLLAVAGKEVEGLVMRLAQKARAAGLHVMLATQRPSVDVITGVIKANFPVRMGFRLASSHDSKTIINQSGAEKLLGRGDMLLMPPGTSVVQRIHGAFLSEKELTRVIDFLKLQGTPNYDMSILADPEEDAAGAVNHSANEDKDEKYDDAVDIVARTRKCSTSWLQRQLNIGYNRAARIVDKMERDGLVGPALNVKGDREIYVKPS